MTSATEEMNGCMDTNEQDARKNRRASGSWMKNEQDVRKNRRASGSGSWMNIPSVNVTPLKKFVENRQQHSTHHSFQEKCKLLREYCCSPEKLTKRTQEEENDDVASLLTPRSGKEDIEHVYENFEILLNVLRVERQKEKLEGEHEVQSLKAKIALLEKANHDDGNADSNQLTAVLEEKMQTARKAIQQQKERIIDEVEKNRILTSKLEQAEEGLKQTREELEEIRGDIRVAEEDKENQSNNGFLQQNVEKKLATTDGKTLEGKMNRQMKELQEKLSKLRGELTGSKRNHSDVLMKLAVESTCKASLTMKLDAAMAQVEKQKETISLLNQELGKAKFERDSYSQKAKEVLDESKKLLLEETRVSLEDFSF